MDQNYKREIVIDPMMELMYREKALDMALINSQGADEAHILSRAKQFLDFIRGPIDAS